MNNSIPLTYLAQVRRIRRSCAFLMYPKHPRLALITRHYSPFKETEKSTVLVKVAVIRGHALGAVKCVQSTNTGAWLRASGALLNTIRFGSSRLHVVVKRLQEKRLMMDTDNLQINCWMLGDYRVSALIKNGRMFRSRNVKREGIHIRISSRRSAQPILLRMGGKNREFLLTARHLWPLYRPIVLNTSRIASFGQDWAKSMTLLAQWQLKVLPVTWLNIYSRITFLTPYGLKTGGEYVTLNPFLNSQNKQQMLLFYSNEMTGTNWRELQSWYLSETPIA